MPPTGVPLKVIKGQQGDRTYFVTSVSNSFYLDMFTSKMDPEDPEDEKAQRNLDAERYAAQKAASEAAAQAKADAKLAAHAKLQALGLTPEEIAALA